MYRLNPCSCGGWSQRIVTRSGIDTSFTVLILVLVEDGLRANHFNRSERTCSCLNPCSCGGWSQRLSKSEQNSVSSAGLNPCSCGGWSQRAGGKKFMPLSRDVLILVLVEDGLRVVFPSMEDALVKWVLILVLVEDGLRVCHSVSQGGICLVLILVLVEDGLRVA